MELCMNRQGSTYMQMHIDTTSTPKKSMNTHKWNYSKRTVQVHMFMTSKCIICIYIYNVVIAA